MTYRLMSLLAAVVSRLPEAVLTTMAAALAALSFDVLRVRRRLVLANLERAFPEKSLGERRHIARASYRNLILTAFEVLQGARLDIARQVEVVGAEHFQAALDGGKGAFILSLHLGNWEVLGATCSRVVSPTHILVKKVGSDDMDRFVNDIRRRNGFLTIIRRGKGDGYRAILQALRSNETVGYIMDQSRPGEPRLPFFGHPAKTNTGLAAIWRRVKAPIIPAYIRRVGFGRHVVEYLPAVALTVSDDAAADILRHSTIFNDVVADLVRRCPEQYLWHHNRWK